MTNFSQISLFPEIDNAQFKNKFERNDVRTGECGVNLTLAVLQSWNINAFGAESGSEYDIIVDHKKHIIKLQVKARRNCSAKIKYSFTRGFHGSKTGVYDYSPNDFDIGACVNIQDRKVLFSYGVNKNINWSRSQFNQENSEIISWKNAFKEYISNKGIYNV